VNATLYAEPKATDGELYVHELIGCTVVDQGGTARGTVTSVEANPASDLLVLDSGALVPARFVTECRDRTVRVEVPEGLFE
jgi:16S rRNA processing protein RimM